MIKPRRLATSGTLSYNVCCMQGTRPGIRTAPRRLGLIGYGAIGREIGSALERLGEADRLAAVLVRPGRTAGPFRAVHSAEDLAAAGASVILECAGHEAVRAFGPQLLAAGADLILTSVGALADRCLVAELRRARAGDARLLLAPGAVGGLDGLIGARLAGLTKAAYTSIKPPHAWQGTVGESALAGMCAGEDRVIFEGTAREAALAFPKNANVAVAVGLCGLGLDETRAVLVASDRVTAPLGVIEAEGAFGTFRFETFAHAAPDNPKTSLLTAYSLLQCGRLDQGAPIFDLLQDDTP